MKSKIQTEWNLKLLYKSKTDPQIEADIALAEKSVKAFAKKYQKDIKYLTDENALFKALTEYEKLEGTPEGIKPILYFFYLTNLDSFDTEAQSRMSLLQQQYSKISNKLIFFPLSLGKISKEKQQKLLHSKKLSHFRYWLKTLFDQSMYQLSEQEEKILSLKSLPAHTLWVDGQERLLSSQTVLYKGKKVPIAEAHMQVLTLPKKERHELYEKIMQVEKGISAFAEAEINAVIIDKKIDDELRGFKRPYSSTILGYQNDEKSVLNFVNTVTKYFSVSHKFYEVKAKMLKMQNFSYVDRVAKVGTTKQEYDFAKSADIVMRSFAKADTEFSTIFEKFLSNGQIDVLSKKGKAGGAYCSSSIGLPTFVLLNHVKSMDSVLTLGHEMGHAINSELSKSQSPLYENYTMSVAEVASIFFENFVFDEVFQTLSAKEKVIALHDRIQRDIQTIFRQIACFNFEVELHDSIRAKGSLSKEEMAELMNKHMKAYLGPKFKMTELDGYFFVSWSHIRRFFYVYSYAYGQLISKALYKKYQADHSYIHEIKKFLSAGGSKSPEDIFKDIGIDTTKPEFFVEGLKSIEEDIERLKKLIK